MWELKGGMIKDITSAFAQKALEISVQHGLKISSTEGNSKVLGHF